MKHEDSGNALMGWMIAGVVAAAAAMALGMTDQGREVTRRAKDRAGDFADNAKDQARRIREEAEDRRMDAGETVSQAQERSQEHRSNATHSLFEALGLLKTAGREVDRIQFVMSDGSVRDLDPRKLDQEEVRFLLGKSSKL